MKRLVLFDIDGTLLTAQGAPRRAFHRAMLEVYGTAGPIATHRFDGKTDPQIARELLIAVVPFGEEVYLLIDVENVLSDVEKVELAQADLQQTMTVQS